MGPLLMPYEKLRAELLEVREQREQRRLQTSQRMQQTLVQLTLNIPGPDKVPPGAKELFGWGLRQLLEMLSLVESCTHGQDLLGPWLLLGSSSDATQLKRQAVVLEHSQPGGRLLDIDIYDRQGRQLDRKFIDLPARSCLVCDQVAIECIRQQTHNMTELKVRIDELLTPFRS